MNLLPLPGHPEPHTHDWSKLELEAIRKYGEACAAAQPHPLVDLLAKALQPLVAENSSRDTVSVVHRTKDITFARAVLAQASDQYTVPEGDLAALFCQIGMRMVEITSTVRGPDEWLAIPDLWEKCHQERTVAVEELMQLGYTFNLQGGLNPPSGELGKAWRKLADICLRLGGERKGTDLRLDTRKIGQRESEPDVPRFIRLPADRGTIDLLDVESVVVGGHYADECTLRMVSGATHSVGSGYNQTSVSSYNHWVNLVQAAKAAYRK